MDDDIRRAVGANVRAEMARRRVHQRQVADVLGISQPQVSERLQGRVAFDVVEIEKLATFLDVPVTRFLPSTERVA